MPRSVISRTIVTLVTLALAACGGDDGGTEPLVATRLAFQVQPVAAVRDTAIPAAITVAVLDQNDDVLTSATNLITVALDRNPGSATLTGTTSAAAVNGVATFTDLKLDATGTGYTLLANAPGLGAGSSGSFNVTLSLAAVDGVPPNAGDCNDGAASIKPGALDRPDGAYVDSNCDGLDGDTPQAV